MLLAPYRNSVSKPFLKSLPDKTELVPSSRVAVNYLLDFIGYLLICQFSIAKTTILVGNVVKHWFAVIEKKDKSGVEEGKLIRGKSLC
jgi:hypothetical protein